MSKKPIMEFDEGIAYVLSTLEPDMVKGLHIWEKYRQGRLSMDEMSAQLRLLAKQKREREAKQRLEEMKAFVDKYIKEARRRGQL